MHNKRLYGQKTSIVINTYNRRKLLLRTCNILEELSFGGQLIICDATEGTSQKEINHEVNQLKLGYELKYLNVPKNGDWFYVSMNKCFEAGIKKINRRYTVLCFEDDIPIPKTLTEMEKYLDTHEEFSSCMGRQIWFNHMSHASTSKIGFFAIFKTLSRFIIGERVGENESGSDIISASAAERINQFTKMPAHYLFALQRSSGIANIITHNFRDFDDDHSHLSTEYYYWFFTVTRGNVKYFHKPYILKTCHEDNLSHPDRLVHLPIFEKVLKPNWSRNIDLFRKNLIDLLQKQDPRLQSKKAMEVVEAYIVFYMEHRIQKPNSSFNLLKQLVKHTFRSSRRIRFEILVFKIFSYWKLSKAILSAEKK